MPGKSASCRRVGPRLEAVVRCPAADIPPRRSAGPRRPVAAGGHAHALHTVCPMSSVLEWPVSGHLARLSTPHASSPRRPSAWRPTGLAHRTHSALNPAPPRDRPALLPLRPGLSSAPLLLCRPSPLRHPGPAPFALCLGHSPGAADPSHPAGCDPASALIRRRLSTRPRVYSRGGEGVRRRRHASRAHDRCWSDVCKLSGSAAPCASGRIWLLPS